MARFCSSCGGTVEPNQKFCQHCGAPVVEPVREKASAAAATPQAQVITNGSPLSRAWADFKAEKGIIGRLAVLSLLGAVPILNFVVMGYCLIWGADAALGRKNGMPEKYVTMPYFTMGFFALVVGLIWGLVFGVLSVIPVVGVLATIALLVLLPMITLCEMRLSLYGTLGSAFEITKVWDLFRSNIGTAELIFWIPQLATVVAAIFVSIVMGLFGGVGLFIAEVAGNSAAAAAGFGTLSIVGFFCCLVLIFAEVGASLVTYRAFGYFVAETAPQWVRDGLVANPQARV